MAMQPIEYEPWLSKMERHVTPAFSVFQTPPTLARYQVLGRWGSKAMSSTRPDIKAGPMLRNFKAETSPESTPGAGSAGWSESWATAIEGQVMATHNRAIQSGRGIYEVSEVNHGFNRIFKFS